MNYEKDDGCGGNLKHNKALPLPESDNCGAEEPHIIHSLSNFNFSGWAQIHECEVNNICFATILMVNVENGLWLISRHEITEIEND